MNSYFSSATEFLIEAVVGLYILAVMLRLVLQFVRADFYNPICQFLVKVTNPPLKPLRRIIPGLGGIDLASILLLIVLQALEIFLVDTVTGRSVTLPGLAVTSLGELISLLLNLYMVSILIQVVLSWVSPAGHTPATALLYYINEPILRKARKILPPVSGFDLSPILVFIAIGVLKFLVVAPVLDLGRSLG